LPLWAVSVFVMILMTGLMPGQPPPSPVISGPVIALLSSALLLVGAPRFFGRQTHVG
jgi:hypothetical protein